MSKQPDYPWFAIVRGNTLEQGDLLPDCPRLLLPAASAGAGEVVSERERVDAIILTQSCDMAVHADGECEAAEVLVCPFRLKKDLANHPLFHKDAAWEEVRKGRRPYFHVLNECAIDGHEQDFALVDFHDLYTLPVALAARSPPRAATGCVCCRRTASTCRRRSPGCSCASGCRPTFRRSGSGSKRQAVRQSGDRGVP